MKEPLLSKNFADYLPFRNSAVFNGDLPFCKLSMGLMNP